MNSKICQEFMLQCTSVSPLKLRDKIARLNYKEIGQTKVLIRGAGDMASGVCSPPF